MTDAVHIEATRMPCGGGCGAAYAVPGLVQPVEIQRAALDGGWGVLEIEGKQVVACTLCIARIESDRR